VCTVEIEDISDVEDDGGEGEQPSLGCLDKAPSARLGGHWKESHLRECLATYLWCTIFLFLISNCNNNIYWYLEETLPEMCQSPPHQHTSPSRCRPRCCTQPPTSQKIHTSLFLCLFDLSLRLKPTIPHPKLAPASAKSAPWHTISPPCSRRMLKRSTRSWRRICDPVARADQSEGPAAKGG
jgi:hypothetical protein